MSLFTTFRLLRHRLPLTTRSSSSLRRNPRLLSQFRTLSTTTPPPSSSSSHPHLLDDPASSSERDNDPLNGGFLMKNSKGVAGSSGDGLVVPAVIHKEASEACISYAISVMALPDVRDGLKPLHRRILYAMHQLGLSSKKPFEKCLTVVCQAVSVGHEYFPRGATVLSHSLSQRQFYQHAYATEIFRDEHQALGLSMVSTAWGTGLVIGMALGGFLTRAFLDFRCSVIERSTRFKLSQAQERRHIVEGFVVGIDNRGEVLDIIRESSSDAAAFTALRNDFNLSEKQAEAIWRDPMRVLSIFQEREGFINEIKSLTEQIPKLEELLSSRESIIQLIEKEAVELKNRFSTPRRSILVNSAGVQLEDIEVIPNEVRPGPARPTGKSGDRPHP